MTPVQIKLRREDREPGGDHVYGTKIDKLIGAVVSRADETKAHLELHEDGPLIQTVIEQIPALISAGASLITAWCAWRSARKDLPPVLKRTLRRTIRVTVGSHTYEGQLAPKDLKRVANLLASLDR